MSDTMEHARFIKRHVQGLKIRIFINSIILGTICIPIGWMFAGLLEIDMMKSTVWIWSIGCVGWFSHFYKGHEQWGTIQAEQIWQERQKYRNAGETYHKLVEALNKEESKTAPVQPQSSYKPVKLDPQVIANFLGESPKGKRVAPPAKPNVPQNVNAPQNTLGSWDEYSLIINDSDSMRSNFDVWTKK